MLLAIFVHTLLVATTFALPTGAEIEPVLKRGASDYLDDEPGTWAGAIYDSDPGTWSSVTTTFIVPTLRELSNNFGFGGADVSVGLDVAGSACTQTSAVQAGVRFIDLGGFVQYKAWYSLPLPNYLRPVVYLPVDILSAHPGDLIKIKLEIAKGDNKNVTITMENRNTREFFEQSFTQQLPFCQGSVVWALNGLEHTSDDSRVPFADFGTFIFQEASANGASGAAGPDKAVILNAKSSGIALTGVKISGDGIAIMRINVENGGMNQVEQTKDLE